MFVCTKRSIMLRTLFVIVCSFNVYTLFAQNKIVIPAYTAYAVPEEINESKFISQQSSVINWSNTNTQIEFYFFAKDTGNLVMNIKAASTIKPAAVNVLFNDAIVKTNISIATHLALSNNIVLHVSTFGFQKISLAATKIPKLIQLQSIELSGTIVNTIEYNKKQRRNAASVHLSYPINDSLKVLQFYNEVRVPKGADIPYSYYETCGFARGYFGIQVNSNKERRVIFSVWDAGAEAVTRTKVADTNRVKLLAKGIDVVAEDFGNEGTGGHSHWVYNWKADSVYKFLVNVIPDSATRTSIYTAYFFIPEKKMWKLIASFKAPKDGNYLNHLYSFNEDFIGKNGQLQRKAYFGNQWIQTKKGEWIELTESKFSTDATGKAGDRIDFGGGADNNVFYLWNGGFKTATAKQGDVFKRIANKQKPNVDITKNIDSAAQHAVDINTIEKAVANKKIDTTGSVNSIYYKILKEGTGEFVKVTDTLTVYYKGSLLSDGSVFDSTKENKPATFPLKRLIKGWQLGLTKCKVGGTIRLIIPSAMAYSIRSRSKDIPPNSILVFDIEVLEAKHEK